MTQRREKSLMHARLSARLVLLTALFMLTLNCAAQEHSETRKKVSVNTPFEIALVTNPSTGYRWTIDAAASANLNRLNIEDLGTSPPPQRGGRPLIGAPVIQTWLVTPMARGSAWLVLTYHRPGERGPEKIHAFSLDIAD